jgi:hypothetical protein
MNHPAYSPDLAPAIFGSFQNKKMPGIPENDFQDCIQQRHHCLTKCIASQGEYFEGDSSCWCTGKQILLSQGHSGN